MSVPRASDGANGATISVVIPAHNAEAWIGQAIDSALMQTHPAMEIIVIDDGSTDGTAARLREYGERIRVLAQAKAGVSRSRNVGMRSARGEFIAFLDADDVWDPRKLELQVWAMREHPEIGVLGTRVHLWPGRVGAVDDRNRPRVERIDREQLMVKNYLTVSAVMVRRELARRVGEFDRNMQGAEDYDYWLRASELAGVANLEYELTGYRSVVGSVSKQAASMERDMRRVLAKLDAIGWSGAGIRNRAHSYCCYSCAYMYSAAGQRAAAFWKLLRSIWLYPLPYRRAEVSMALARPRMLGVLALRMLRLTRNGAAGGGDV